MPRRAGLCHQSRPHIGLTIRAQIILRLRQCYWNVRYLTNRASWRLPKPRSIVTLSGTPHFADQSSYGNQ